MSENNISEGFRLSKCTNLLVEEARRHGLQVTYFAPVSTVMAVFEWQGHREEVMESSTKGLSVVTYKLTKDKALCSLLLRERGFRVPEEILTDKVEEVKAFLRRFKRVVIKPNNLTWGLGVMPDITNEEELEFAFHNALKSHTPSRQADSQVICQEHVTGPEYRLLVIGKRRVYALRRLPAHIKGNGQQTIQQLIEDRNEVEKNQVVINDVLRHVLKRQELDLESVPEIGRIVAVAAVANAHAGGTTEDATDVVGEEVKLMACRLAESFDMPIVGIDCISDDITKSMGHVIELNSTPDIAMHHAPTHGEPRNTAAAVLGMLFPEIEKLQVEQSVV